MTRGASVRRSDAGLAPRVRKPAAPGAAGGVEAGRARERAFVAEWRALLRRYGVSAETAGAAPGAPEELIIRVRGGHRDLAVEELLDEFWV